MLLKPRMMGIVSGLVFSIRDEAMPCRANNHNQKHSLSHRHFIPLNDCIHCLLNVDNRVRNNGCWRRDSNEFLAPTEWWVVGSVEETSGNVSRGLGRLNEF